jgi:hypothetical protein
MDPEGGSLAEQRASNVWIYANYGRNYARGNVMTTGLKELFAKYDVPAPRYTSYPTVQFWTESPTTEQ